MRILLRCDGGPGIGVGHVVRCLSLAEEALRRGHDVALAGIIEGPFLHELIESLPRPLSLLGPPDDNSPSCLATLAVDYDVLHIDHYDLGTDLHDVLRARAGDEGGSGAPSPWPTMSNMSDGRYGARSADLAIDPTPGAQGLHVNAPAARWLLGERYAVIRGTVLSQRGQIGMAGPHTRPRVLVVMGGTDAQSCAPRVVDALAESGVALDVTVIATVHTRSELEEQASHWSRGRLNVLEPVADLPARMAAADVVVTAAGTSVWELCAMGQAMAAVVVVENQRLGYQSLLDRGGAIGLGTPLQVADARMTARRLLPALTDELVRRQLSAAASTFVDGAGAWRLVSAWEAIRAGASSDEDAGSVVARPAVDADAETLWRWRNDPGTRAHSRSTQTVPLEQHIAWLNASLRRRDRLLLVASDDEGPVGTVRWDHQGHGEWEVSITVAPERRGKRLARPLLAAGERALNDHVSRPLGESVGQVELTAYLAVMHVDNPGSRRLFLGSGYLPDRPPDADGFERYVKFVARSGPT